MQQSDHIIVIGAGINGVASAIWLKRYGYDVTLMDKNAVGMGASFGNAGLLATSAFLPVTGPGLISKALFYALSPHFPLFLRWRYFPKLVPWLTRYLSHANAKDTRAIAKGLFEITHDSVEQHKALTTGGKAARWIMPSEYGYVFKNRAEYEADAFSWAVKKEYGIEPEWREGRMVQECEPMLSTDLSFMLILKNHGFILNPEAYIKELADDFLAMGGRYIQGEIADIERHDGKIKAVITKDKQHIACDKAVITAGIWSRSLMQRIGLDVPLESERGYHILFKEPSEKPNRPLMIASGKFVATPMAMGLRCAGTVEFGGLTPEKSKAPLDFIRKKVKETFPNLDAKGEETWLGFRPATPDSLPLIGEVGNSDIYVGFGHQHIGLTAGAKTGRFLADIISKRPPNIDMRPYHPHSF